MASTTRVFYQNPKEVSVGHFLKRPDHSRKQPAYGPDGGRANDKEFKGGFIDISRSKKQLTLNFAFMPIRPIAVKAG